MFELLSWLLFTGLALLYGGPFLLLYYWIALDEMKNQHPLRRRIWLLIVPLCLILAPTTIGLSLIPMMFFIALGEAFDKPKEAPKTKTDLKIERFFSKTPFQRTLYIAFSICFIVLLALMFIQTLTL
jgi:hypothetical protein